MPSAPNNFVNLQDYLNANSAAVGRTSANLASQDTTEAQNSKNASDAVAKGVHDQAAAQGPGNQFDQTQFTGYGQALADQTKAGQDLKGLTSFGGVSRQLQDTYGQGQYSQGDRAFDANLLGGSGAAQGQFKSAQNQFGGLDTYLQDTTTKSKAAGEGEYVPPVEAPPTPKKQLDPYGNPNTRPQVPGEAEGGGVFKDYGKPEPGRRIKGEF